MTRLWDRNEPFDELVLAYTAGDDHALDERLVRFDIRASAAHASALHAAGLLSAADHEALQVALRAIGEAHARGDWHVRLDDEDGHTALENRLVEATGDAGERIHLGRSRNDQVLAALRLWLKDALEELAVQAEGTAAALEGIADRLGSLVMPGYTHMQRAMPTTLGRWALAFAAEIRDDADGLRAGKRRADLNPLGSAAGYGVPVIALDRERTTQALGFAATHEPVTAVQLSRGKAEAGALFEVALLAQDLGRLAADFCLFATAEFGFVALPPALTTGSSMLPHKRNPDVFEVVRGRSGEAVAALFEVLAVTIKMPSGYHRDLQLIKRPLFRAFDSASASARVLAHVLPLVEFDAARMRDAVDASLTATERAYRMVVEQGLPFREAYRRAREE